MNFIFLRKGRTYLFIGAGFLLASMPLVAYGDISSASGNIEGWKAWVCSITLVPTAGIVIFGIGTFFCALWNIPQLIFPLRFDPKAGTSSFTCWSFSILSCVLPVLALYFIYGQAKQDLIFREGYFLYQAGYLISTLGFWMKRKAFRKVVSL